MRILHITGSFPPMQCGVGAYTRQLVCALVGEAEVEIAVMTSQAADQPSLKHNHEFWPIIQRWDWREAPTVLKRARSWKPDVIHIQYPTMGYGRKPMPWLLPIYLRAAGFAVVQTWHCRIPRFEEFFDKRVLRPRLGVISNGLVSGGLVLVREEARNRADAVQRWVFRNKVVKIIPNASALPTVDINVKAREEIRQRYGRPFAHLIVFFGFIYPQKRVELLFQIADPTDSHVVIIGDSIYRDRRDSDPYYQSLHRIAATHPWESKATMVGYLPEAEAARVLAAADAVVLPYKGGAGDWNSSLRAARAQGTFIITTSSQRAGYDSKENTFYTTDDNIEEMKAALRRYRGTHLTVRETALHAWQSIRDEHVGLYKAALTTFRK